MKTKITKLNAIMREYKCSKCGTVRYYPAQWQKPVHCPKC